MAPNSDIPDSAGDCPTHGIRLSKGVCWRCREAEMLSGRRVGPGDLVSWEPAEEVPVPLDALPDELLRMAKHGYELFWLLAESRNGDDLPGALTISQADASDLLVPPITRQRELLISNAVLLVPNSEAAQTAWDGLLSFLRVVPANRRENAIRVSDQRAAFDDFRRSNATAVRVHQAQARARATIERLGYRWDDESKRVVAQSKVRGGPSHFVAEMVVALYEAWWDEYKQEDKFCQPHHERIARALRWFFQPGLLTRRKIRAAVDNYLNRSDAP